MLIITSDITGWPRSSIGTVPTVMRASPACNAYVARIKVHNMAVRHGKLDLDRHLLQDSMLQTTLQSAWKVNCC